MSASRPFLTAEWRYLAMLNFEIAPAALEPHVPSGTELDIWNGRALVSIVGFLFRETRVLGVKIPRHVNFEELNLRFYVRRSVAGETRRGVVFIKELVPRWAVATIARRFYNENYQWLPMRHSIQPRDDSWQVNYQWRLKGHWSGVNLTAIGEPKPLEPGSHEAFIAEHYFGYGRQQNGATLEYEVEHPPWRIWPNCTASFDCNPSGLYPPEFIESLRRPPYSAFLAEGSPISVSWPRPVSP